MRKHTAGPWRICRRTGNIYGNVEGGALARILPVIDGRIFDGNPQDAANAHLIVAAPGLLAACRAALPLMEEACEPTDEHNPPCPEVVTCYCLLRDAIQKAEGDA
jgi:hypothetical protein